MGSYRPIELHKRFNSNKLVLVRIRCLKMASPTNYYALIFIVLCVKLGIAQTTYEADVIEYAKTGSEPTNLDDLLGRVREYKNLIADSYNKNIIVFPEYGLTTPSLPVDLEPLSTLVPDPIEMISPCTGSNSNIYKNFLQELSCQAKQSRIYVVVNLIESAKDSSNSTIYYNTNVVFDGDGTVVARYRKINLCNEPQFTKGENISTFTAFGVNFGLMTCCDLLFEHPSRTLLVNTNVTDIIYPHAWIAETPFLHSLSIQDGFAKAHGINLLSSTYRNATAGMGGAGIFHANSTANELKISTTISSSHTTGTLQKLTSKLPESVCKNNIEISPRIGGTTPPPSEFNNRVENLDLYTTKDLEVINNESKVQVCSEGSLFCCDFYVQFKNYTNTSSPVYKVAAFYGSKRVNMTDQTLGFRTCALLVCVNNVLQSCTDTPPDSSPISQITLKVNLPKDDRTLYMPSTLKNDLYPLKGYAFCQNAEDDVIGTTMSASNVEKLWTFGIVGRAYHLDGTPEGRGTANYVRSGFGFILMLIVTQFFLQ